jgi:hypothetical protein
MYVNIAFSLNLFVREFNLTVKMRDKCLSVFYFISSLYINNSKYKSVDFLLSQADKLMAYLSLEQICVAHLAFLSANVEVCADWTVQL